LETWVIITERWCPAGLCSRIGTVSTAACSAAAA
jgi:hypothetical protein